MWFIPLTFYDKTLLVLWVKTIAKNELNARTDVLVRTRLCDINVLSSVMVHHSVTIASNWFDGVVNQHENNCRELLQRNDIFYCLHLYFSAQKLIQKFFFLRKIKSRIVLILHNWFCGLLTNFFYALPNFFEIINISILCEPYDLII